MKLLFDENLSRRLADSLKSLFPESTHVSTIGLQRAADEAVWDFAMRNGFALVSKDSDFHQRSLLYGHPPKVIWIALGNCTTSEVEELLNTRAEDIFAFGLDVEESFLKLRP